MSICSLASSPCARRGEQLFLRHGASRPGPRRSSASAGRGRSDGVPRHFGAAPGSLLRSSRCSGCHASVPSVTAVSATNPASSAPATPIRSSAERARNPGSQPVSSSGQGHWPVGRSNELVVDAAEYADHVRHEQRQHRSPGSRRASCRAAAAGRSRPDRAGGRAAARRPRRGRACARAPGRRTVPNGPVTSIGSSVSARNAPTTSATTAPKRRPCSRHHSGRCAVAGQRDAPFVKERQHRMRDRPSPPRARRRGIRCAASSRPACDSDSTRSIRSR